MTIFGILPIEEEGISVLSLFIFAFAGIGAAVVLKWVTERFEKQDERFKAQDEKFTHHDQCVEEIRKELSDGRVQFAKMDGTLSQIRMIVDRIDASSSDIAKTNMKVIESYLKRDE